MAPSFGYYMLFYMLLKPVRPIGWRLRDLGGGGHGDCFLRAVAEGLASQESPPAVLTEQQGIMRGAVWRANSVGHVRRHMEDYRKSFFERKPTLKSGSPKQLMLRHGLRESSYKLVLRNEELPLPCGPGAASTPFGKNSLWPVDLGMGMLPVRNIAVPFAWCCAINIMWSCNLQRAVRSPTHGSESASVS